MADDPKKPYGKVRYADPGYQADGKARYPLDTEEHCRAAWSYINQAGNAGRYTPEQLRRIKARVKAALRTYGVDIAEDTKMSRLDIRSPSGRTRAHLDRSALADDAPLRFVASSNGTNRYGFALRNDGWLLDHYIDNPVFLWAHDTSRPPIGRSPARPEPPELAAYVTFDRDDEFARQVEGKYRRGFLNTVSVSWDWVGRDGAPVADAWRMTPAQARDELFYDLAEISAVPVPGDPRALQANQRRALASLGRQMLALYDEREHGTASAGELRRAVVAELARLGVPIPPDARPAPGGPPPPAPDDVPGIDQDAAQAVLAAFTLTTPEGTPA
ncbi:MAG TPA: DUF6582 domain-containing protein [Micromonosporaceae bacterium]|nr:DUF6582 domain-containing protein [Micromonosporaceae bacterium]